MNKVQKLMVVGSGLVLAISARAADFDAAVATAGFSTAAATAATLVGSLIALGAGIAVYKKIKGYFSKAN